MFQPDSANPIKTIHAVCPVPFLGGKLSFGLFFEDFKHKQAHESHKCDPE